MKLLAFDTTTRQLAACVWQDGPTPHGQVVAGRTLAMERGHAEALVPLLQEIMAEAGTVYQALDGVAVTCGPGAFTGIRIGLATARGIALAADIPAIGVGTLEALAATAAGDAGGRDVLALLDTKRRDLYAALFDGKGACLAPPQVTVPNEVPALLRPDQPTLIAGDAEALLGEVMLPASAEVTGRYPGPAAGAIAQLAAARLAAAGRVGDLGGPPEPVYLRPPEARLPAGG